MKLRIYKVEINRLSKRRFRLTGSDTAGNVYLDTDNLTLCRLMRYIGFFEGIPAKIFKAPVEKKYSFIIQGLLNMPLIERGTYGIKRTTKNKYNAVE